MRYRSIALALAALASFILASVAAAGGWAKVSATNVPVDPPAGEETTIELSMLQHGVTPVSWPRLTVIATDAASGAVVRAEAAAIGATGSYAAKIVFPTTGDWTLSFESTDLIMEGSVPMHVAAPLAAAPAGTPTGVASGGLTSIAIPLLLGLGIAALVVIGPLALRGRRGSSGTEVSART